MMKRHKKKNKKNKKNKSTTDNDMNMIDKENMDTNNEGEERRSIGIRRRIRERKNSV